MNPSPTFYIASWTAAILLICALAFGVVATRAQDAPPVQAQATGYQIGDPSRFGDTPLAEMAGMTYAQRVGCSPAMTETGPGPLFCGVHPGGGDMFRAEFQHILHSRGMPRRWFLQEDAIMVVDDQEYVFYIDDGGFFYVSPALE